MDCCGGNLLSQMAALRDLALGQVCDASSVSPLFRSVILRTFSYETDSYSYQQITPTPFVDENPEGVDSTPGVDNINGDSTRYLIHVSRQYARSVLEAQTTDFIIGGSLVDLNAGDRFSGNLCELETIDDKVTYWEINLIEKVVEQVFTLE